METRENNPLKDKFRDHKVILYERGLKSYRNGKGTTSIAYSVEEILKFGGLCVCL